MIFTLRTICFLWITSSSSYFDNIHTTHAYDLFFLGNPIIADFGALKLICYFDVEGFELKGPGEPQEQHDHGYAQEVLHL